MWNFGKNDNKEWPVNSLHGKAYTKAQNAAMWAADDAIVGTEFEKYARFTKDSSSLITVRFDASRYAKDNNIEYDSAVITFSNAVVAKIARAGFIPNVTAQVNGPAVAKIVRVSNTAYQLCLQENVTRDCLNILAETGIDVYRPDFITINEAAQLQVTDEALSGMMKFITDKYNALDFSEIEKSAGDINRFKYTQMINENTEMLRNIYEASNDPGAKKYLDVVNAVDHVMRHLSDNRAMYSDLYKCGNGMVQLLYTSMVAACLYAVGTLVSNTIRFVTTEKDTDCEVLFDEIPGSIKHVHIKNILAADAALPEIRQMLVELNKSHQHRVNESVTAGGVVAGLGIAAGVVLLIPRIIVLIREIIYSIYYSRVKTAEMLSVQIDLIRTNIESLEAGRGNKKVIARQKKIAQKLEKWQNKISLKMDTTEVAKKTQQRKEDQSLKIDQNSPLVQDALNPGGTDGIMI